MFFHQFGNCVFRSIVKDVQGDIQQRQVVFKIPNGFEQELGPEFFRLFKSVSICFKLPWVKAINPHYFTFIFCSAIKRLIILYSDSFRNQTRLFIVCICRNFYSNGHSLLAHEIPTFDNWHCFERLCQEIKKAKNLFCFSEIETQQSQSTRRGYSGSTDLENYSFHNFNLGLVCSEGQ